MKVWATKPVHPTRESVCSPHLYRDCQVLVRRDELFRDPKVYEYIVRDFTRSLGRFYTVDVGVGRFRYGVCERCVSRALDENPDLLKKARNTKPPQVGVSPRVRRRR